MRLLTAVSLVRVQQGELVLNNIPWLHGQAVKTPPFHGGNRGSNPLGVTDDRKIVYADVAQLAEQLICNQQVIGSSPIIGLNETIFHLFPALYGILAQLGEHLPYKQRVTGSSPVGPIISFILICRRGGTGRRTGLKILRD